MTANSPPSSIKKNYINDLNSDNLTERFLTSTPVHSQKKIKVSNKYYYAINAQTKPNNFEGTELLDLDSQQYYSETQSGESKFLEETISNSYRSKEIEHVTEQNFKIDDDAGKSSVLHKILHNQEAFLKNQETMMKTLTNMQAQMDLIEKKINDVSENRSPGPSELATNKLIRESVVYGKRNSKMLRMLTGEDKNQFGDEIETSFPAKTIDDINNTEVRLLNLEFAQALTIYFRRFKSHKDTVDAAFKYIASDEVYIHFNLQGVQEKKALKKFKIFSNILFDACGNDMGLPEFLTQLR